MIVNEKREKIHKAILNIINELQGDINDWDFKQYVLTILFYRFLSEKFSTYYMGNGTDFRDYENYEEENITEDIKKDAIETLGYFIYPHQLFANVFKHEIKNENLYIKINEVLSAIENSSNGYDSEKDFKGIFDDINTTSISLGKTVEIKNTRLAAVMRGVANLDIGNLSKNNMDLLGEAYEFIVAFYNSHYRNYRGEFFTPQSISKLLMHLVMHNKKNINKIYDPACGSGSLLLQAKKYFEDEENIEEGFFGQEINPTTYNLARMNMFLHGVNYTNFNIALGDTLLDPQFIDQDPFDAIVSNPPYSIRWKGSDDPTLINDDRFAPAGKLAPKKRADLAFVLHALHYLSPKGRAAIVCFPGIFYRGGAEQKIRQYLVDNNYVESIISLAPELFFGTRISVTLLILSKDKQNNDIQFINATGEEFFEKTSNGNIITDKHIKKFVDIFASKKEIPYIAKNVSSDIIAAKDYNLVHNRYIEAKYTHEQIDIQQLNSEIDTIVVKNNELRANINNIIARI